MDRQCRECSTPLVPNVNWSLALVKKPEYHCKECRRNRQRNAYAEKYKFGVVSTERIINDRFNAEIAGNARAKHLATMRKRIEQQIASLPAQQTIEDRVIQIGSSA